MTRSTFALFVPLMMTAGLAAQSQTPTTAPTQGASQATQTVTVEGCVSESPADPAVSYVLTNAKVVKGPAAPTAGAATPGGSAMPDPPSQGTPAETGVSTLRYDIAGLEIATLKQHLNRRVQLDGMFTRTDATAGRAGAVSNESAAPAIPLMGIQATAIRRAAGECAVR